VVAQVGTLAYLKHADENWLSVCVRSLPLRAGSRAWGALHNRTLPEFMRAPMYKAWMSFFDGNIEEAELPLVEYPTLNSFFTRKLKAGSRTIAAADTCDLVSPVDGKVMVHGIVEDGDRLEQIKGQSYSLRRFLGTEPKRYHENSTLHYIVLYLAPGDYHRMHMSNDFKLLERRHIAGELFPVAPAATKRIPSLFARNERIVLNGAWQHGFFSYTPVGAYNVGSIRLTFDHALLTNVKLDEEEREQLSAYGAEPVEDVRTYRKGMVLSRGEEVARFELGSTVVLVAEVPEGKTLHFNFDAASRVQVGQALASVVDA
jgi:phosphatidylserine decarboxylase